MTRQEFSQQVKATQQSLRRFLMALCCGDSMLADDIAQETYIKAYLALDSVRNPEKMRSWLFSIAYNSFISHRRSMRPQEPLNESSAMTHEAHSPTPFEYQELYLALSQLTPKERTAILLFHLQGYSIKEVAQIIHTTENAVKQLLTRGRAHLKLKLSSSL